MITTHQHYLIDFGSELISSLILSNYFEYKLQTEEVEIQTFNSEKNRLCRSIANEYTKIILMVLFLFTEHQENTLF